MPQRRDGRERVGMENGFISPVTPAVLRLRANHIRMSINRPEVVLNLVDQLLECLT